MWRRKSLLAFAAAFFMANIAAQSAWAGVQGKEFEVIVITSSDEILDDLWSFGFEGEFSIGVDQLVGGYEQTDFGFLAIFSASASDGEEYSVEFSGLQISSYIIATGTSSQTESFVVIGKAAAPQPPSTRRR